MRLIYSFSWNRFVQLILPPFVRTQAMVDWLMALLWGIREVKAASVDLHEKNLDRASWTSQRLLMEKLMNDLFDPQLRNIRILNTPQNLNAEFFFTRKEGKTPRFVRFRDEPVNPDYRRFRSELDQQQPVAPDPNDPHGTETPPRRQALPGDAIFKVPFYCIESRVIEFIELLLVAGVRYELQTTFPALPPGENYPNYT